MNESIKQKLTQHYISHINERYTDECTNFEELHHEVFNEDYYIIGNYQAAEWLKIHDIDAFEAIAYVIEKENEYFGESNLKPSDINSERIVNLLIYFAEFDVMPGVDLRDTTKLEVLASLENN